MACRQDKEKGLILIVVLWILFFLAVTVISLGARSRMNISLRSLQNENMKMFYLAKTGISRAVSVLEQDDAVFDALSDNWAQNIISENEEDILSVSVTDENRYLNINTASEQILDNVRSIFPAITEEKIRAVIKNRPFSLISEVKDILEMDDKDFYGDADVGKIGFVDVATTFSDGKININTVPGPVLRIIPEMTDSAVESIIVHRQNSPFMEKEMVSQELSLIGLSPAQISSLVKFVQVDSKAFRIKAKARSKRKPISRDLEIVIKRQEEGFDILMAKEN